ncbi:hypothetical protein ALC57_10485 [Trachymyrmex cornetzi]|uniref:Uncharacterized protein n=1 Tax=Trachymyrmex cornetzi TaxID=471704 RepID=A0A195DWH9_9HYME|nr:hypothetical protein ALC57_10485 [Trachymyrmex cornetzi]
MKLSRPGAKSVKRRMFSNISRLVTSLVGRALPSLHAVQIPRWKRLRDEMSSRVDYDVGKVAVRLKLGYLRRKRMLHDAGQRPHMRKGSTRSSAHEKRTLVLSSIYKAEMHVSHLRPSCMCTQKLTSRQDLRPIAIRFSSVYRLFIKQRVNLRGNGIKIEDN